MIVKASTYRDHVVVCGLGHVGYRILLELLEQGASVVAIEKNAEGRFVADAKATGTPVLIRDMKEDQALIDAGVEHARIMIVASDDDLANVEVALDSRRLNPQIRVVLRMFDQRIADKFKAAGLIDEAFSTAALAAPIVAGLALKDARVKRTVEASQA
jgi:Trk K+ transport system NAD-binding subunit